VDKFYETLVDALRLLISLAGAFAAALLLQVALFLVVLLGGVFHLVACIFIDNPATCVFAATAATHCFALVFVWPFVDDVTRTLVCNFRPAAASPVVCMTRSFTFFVTTPVVAAMIFLNWPAINEVLLPEPAVVQSPEAHPPIANFGQNASEHFPSDGR
jgi:hypothetical protein